MKSTFPYRDIVQADIEAQAKVMQELMTLFNTFSQASDDAFDKQDFKGHAVFAMAANKIAGIIKAQNIK